MTNWYTPLSKLKEERIGGLTEELRCIDTCRHTVFGSSISIELNQDGFLRFCYSETEFRELERPMTDLICRSVILVSRPSGEPVEANFAIAKSTVPDIEDGQVLVETIWLSLDPYMRGHMDIGAPNSPGVQLGSPMRAETVGRVLLSRDGRLSSDDIVTGYTFWQTHTVCSASDLRKLDPAFAPPQTALGVLGMTGMTAYVGLIRIGQPKPGETVAVAAATGPVGSIVVQLAKRHGCKVVGIAGGAVKCAYLRETLGLDAAVDHRQPDFPARLAEACPNGIDVYFESVGGQVWQAVQPLLNNFARVPVCGMVAHYSDTAPPPEPDRVPALMDMILGKRLKLQGFMVFDDEAVTDEFHATMGPLLQQGEIVNLEDVTEGLENAPARFIGMLNGGNFGKTLIKVGVA